MDRFGGAYVEFLEEVRADVVRGFMGDWG